MSFVYPAGLWALLALGVFAAVCLIRHRSEVTPVSSTYLWRLSEQRRKKKGYWRTLKRSLFFALQFLALTLSALLAGQAARRLIMPGAVCSLAVSAGALLLTDLFNAVAFTYSHGTPPGEAMWLTAREILLSLPFAMLVHLVFSRVHRRFDRR